MLLTTETTLALSVLSVLYDNTLQVGDIRSTNPTLAERV